MPHYHVWAALSHHTSQTVSNPILVINGAFCHRHYWGKSHDRKSNDRDCYLVLLTASIFIGQHFTLSHCPPSPICQNCTPTGIMVASLFSQVRPPTLCHSQTRPRSTRTNHPFLVRLHSLQTPPGTPHMCDRPAQPVSFGCRPDRCAPWL